jgi:hypothetical protein
MQLDLGLSGKARSPLMRRIAAMVAPVAHDASAVTDDERLLKMAQAVCDAFANENAANGLTRAEVAEQVAGDWSPDELDARINLFVRLEMLRPILDKKHQQRYVLNPAGVVGLLVFQRFGERGGIDELLHLLDRTRLLIERGQGTETTVFDGIERVRGLFALFANELNRLVTVAPLEELLEERRFHDRGDLLSQVVTLNSVVTDEYPGLDAPAYRLVTEAQRYLLAVQNLVERVLEEGGEARDFGVLAPEDYLTAAITARVDALAAVCATVVFDPARPWLDAGAIVEVVETYRPRRTVRIRPPEPAGGSAGDPLTPLEEAAAQVSRRRALKAEQHLQGKTETALATALRGSGWPGAAGIFADFLALDGDEKQPYRVDLEDELIVDQHGPVTFTPVGTLRRLEPTPLVAGQAMEEEAAMPEASADAAEIGAATKAVP